MTTQIQRNQFTSSTNNKITFNRDICYGCQVTLSLKILSNNGVLSQPLSISITNNNTPVGDAQMATNP